MGRLVGACASDLTAAGLQLCRGQRRCKNDAVLRDCAHARHPLQGAGGAPVLVQPCAGRPPAMPEEPDAPRYMRAEVTLAEVGGLPSQEDSHEEQEEWEWTEWAEDGPEDGDDAAVRQQPLGFVATRDENEAWHQQPLALAAIRDEDAAWHQQALVLAAAARALGRRGGAAAAAGARLGGPAAAATASLAQRSSSGPLLLERPAAAGAGAEPAPCGLFGQGCEDASAAAAAQAGAAPAGAGRLVRVTITVTEQRVISFSSGRLLDRRDWGLPAWEWPQWVSHTSRSIVEWVGLLLSRPSWGE